MQKLNQGYQLIQLVFSIIKCAKVEYFGMVSVTGKNPEHQINTVLRQESLIVLIGMKVKYGNWYMTA